MGAEAPSQRKKRSTSLVDATSKRAKEQHSQSWQWGPYESLLIDEDGDEVLSLAVHLAETSPADALVGSPDSSKQLISPSMPGSSSQSTSPISRSTTPGSTSGSLGGIDGKAQRMVKRKTDGGEGSTSVSSGGLDDFYPSRWDSGRWSCNSSFREKSGRPPCKSTMCNCAAGVTADVAAVCCCPFSVLHLLAIAFIKLPSALVSKSLARLKKKIRMRRRKRAASAATSYEDDNESVAAASSYPPSRSRSYEAADVQSWAPALAFREQRLWRDYGYFDAPDTPGTSGNNDEVGKAKS